MDKEDGFTNKLNRCFSIFCKLEILCAVLVLVYYFGFLYPDIVVPDAVLDFFTMEPTSLAILGLGVPIGLTIAIMGLFLMLNNEDEEYSYSPYTVTLILLIPNFVGLALLTLTSAEQFYAYLLATFLPLAVYTVMFASAYPWRDKLHSDHPRTAEDLRRLEALGYTRYAVRRKRSYYYETQEKTYTPRTEGTGEYDVRERNGKVEVKERTRTVYDEGSRTVTKTATDKKCDFFNSFSEMTGFLASPRADSANWKVFSITLVSRQGIGIKLSRSLVRMIASGELKG